MLRAAPGKRKGEGNVQHYNCVEIDLYTTRELTSATCPPQEDGYDSLVDVQVKKWPYKASWWSQFRNVLWRSWLEVIREPMLIKVRFFQVMVSLGEAAALLSVHLLVTCTEVLLAECGSFNDVYQ